MVVDLLGRIMADRLCTCQEMFACLQRWQLQGRRHMKERPTPQEEDVTWLWRVIEQVVGH